MAQNILKGKLFSIILVLTKFTEQRLSTGLSSKSKLTADMAYFTSHHNNGSVHENNVSSFHSHVCLWLTNVSGYPFNMTLQAVPQPGYNIFGIGTEL